MARGTPLKIIRWKDLEIISWILDNIKGGLFLEIISGYLNLRTKDVKYSKGQPPLEIILEIIFRGTGAPSLGRGDVLGTIPGVT